MFKEKTIKIFFLSSMVLLLLLILVKRYNLYEINNMAFIWMGVILVVDYLYFIAINISIIRKKISPLKRIAILDSKNNNIDIIWSYIYIILLIIIMSIFIILGPLSYLYYKYIHMDICFVE